MHPERAKMSMEICKSAVGVFDSGLGGLTAVKELKKILPGENIIYFGDTGRVPYGTRSAEIITKYALDDMNFLSSFGVKAVLIACGTVSSIAIDALKNAFNIPIMGVVEPACKEACNKTIAKRIALLATPATVRNAAYQRHISSIMPDARFSGIGCPMFVPLVENGYVDKNCKVTRLIADEYILKLKEFDPDVIILGCTHYPIISDIIQESARCILNKEVEIVDSGSQGAKAIKDYLSQNSLLNTDLSLGNTEFFVSDETQDFSKSASIFLGQNISNVTKIDIAKFTYIKP